MGSDRGSDGQPADISEPVCGGPDWEAAPDGDGEFDGLDRALTDELWNRAELAWKLREYQRPLYDITWAFLRGHLSSRKFFEYCHRRYGKSFCFFLIAVEVGLGKECRDWSKFKRIIRFAAPTLLDLEEIYHPIAEELFTDCPDDLRPVWRTTRGRGHYLFPSTGAHLYLFGVDKDHYKKGRGKKTHLGIVDEAGFCEPSCSDGVRGFVNSVLLPQTFGRDVNGCVVIGTTPAETPAHPSVQLRAECESVGAFAKIDIDQTAHYFGPDIVAEYARESGGRETTTFRREYGCEEVIDEGRAVIPEFAALANELVKPVPRPTWEQPTMALDVGFKDLMASVYGYWDFHTATLMVQAESTRQGATTRKVAEDVEATEAFCWPVEGSKRRDIVRWSDTDLRLIADLSVEHALHVNPTAKDDKEAQVNGLRLLVQAKKIRIDPSCRVLIATLKSAIWNKSRTEFEHIGILGHADALDALLYLARNVDRHTNPFPLYEGLDPLTHHIPVHSNVSETAQALGTLFKIRGRS